MGGRDLRNVKCTCNCTLDMTAPSMHESLDFPTGATVPSPYVNEKEHPWRSL